jgi:hypothetical protein
MSGKPKQNLCLCLADQETASLLLLPLLLLLQVC